MKTLCYRCNAVVEPDTEGLCYKLLGRDIERFMCLDCLSAYIRLPREALLDMILRFRKEGCQLFTPYKEE